MVFDQVRHRLQAIALISGYYMMIYGVQSPHCIESSQETGIMVGYSVVVVVVVMEIVDIVELMNDHGMNSWLVMGYLW